MSEELLDGRHGLSVMKKFAYARHPMGWIIKNKLRSLLGKPVCLDKKWYDVGQDPMQGNLGRE